MALATSRAATKMLARPNVTVTETKTALLRASLWPSRNMEAPAHMGVVSSGLGQERSVSVVNEMSSRGKKGLSRVGLSQLLGIHNVQR
jgi:hypothetical protein